jgi:hypothetical protein
MLHVFIAGRKVAMKGVYLKKIYEEPSDSDNMYYLADVDLESPKKENTKKNQKLKSLVLGD